MTSFICVMLCDSHMLPRVKCVRPYWRNDCFHTQSNEISNAQISCQVGLSTNNLKINAFLRCKTWQLHGHCFYYWVPCYELISQSISKGNWLNALIRLNVNFYWINEFIRLLMLVNVIRHLICKAMPLTVRDKADNFLSAAFVGWFFFNHVFFVFVHV
jgi:hypothetical protein